MRKKKKEDEHKKEDKKAIRAKKRRNSAERSTIVNEPLSSENQYRTSSDGAIQIEVL